MPTNNTETERLIHRIKHYVLVDGRLMRKNAKVELLQKCISQKEGVKILQEIHAGSCGNHTTSRSLVGKAFRASFYWPTAISDAENLVRRCEGCQFFAKQIRADTRAMDHPSFLALCMLGTGYDWAFQASARWLLVRLRRY